MTGKGRCLIINTFTMIIILINFAKKKGITIDRNTKIIHIENGPKEAYLSKYESIESMKGGPELVSLLKEKKIEVQMIAEHIGGEENNDKNSIFTWHKDKNNLPLVTFVPVRGYSYTLLIVSNDCTIQDDTKSFNNFVKSQTNNDKEQIMSFIKEGQQIIKDLKGDYKIVYLLMKPGIFLTFPASQIHHSSIVPKQSTKRILWILYDLIVTR